MKYIIYFSYNGVRMHLEMSAHYLQALITPKEYEARLPLLNSVFRSAVYAAVQLRAGEALIELMRDVFIMDDERLDLFHDELLANWRAWFRQANEDVPRPADVLSDLLQDTYDKVSDVFIRREDGEFVFRGNGEKA